MLAFPGLPWFGWGLLFPLSGLTVAPAGSPIILAIAVARPWGRVPLPDPATPRPHTLSQPLSPSPPPGHDFLLWQLEPCPSEHERFSPGSPIPVPQRREREERGSDSGTPSEARVPGWVTGALLFCSQCFSPGLHPTLGGPRLALTGLHPTLGGSRPAPPGQPQQRQRVSFLHLLLV